MTATASMRWPAANRQYLLAEIARIRGYLEWYVEHRSPPPAASTEYALLEPPAAIDTLAGDFGLRDFERDLLLLCAGSELDDRFGALCAAAHGEPGVRRPTFGMAIAALPNPEWGALLPVAPLRRRRMIELAPGETLTASPLRLDERILHQLMGLGYLDERLQGLVEPVSRPASLPGSYRESAERIVRAWQQSQGRTEEAWPLIHLTGNADGGKQALAAAACSAVGLRLHALHAAGIPASLGEREALARIWDREAILSRSALLIDAADGLDSAAGTACLDFLNRLQSPALYAGSEAVGSPSRPVLRLEINRPAAAEQRALWQSALGPAAATLNGQLDALTAQFSLDVEQIRAAGVALQSDRSFAAAPADRLWEMCRDSMRRPLDKLAQRIPAIAAWEDLVLPEISEYTLRNIAAHVRRRGTVYEAWGFAARGARGLGMTALFAGPSGTGKTMAAEVLARDLCLDLYRIDLSQVVSKYIGETEKNLAQVFQAAEGCGAILLFDEADALFGKRSEVKDSHDRYANIEISYLLQRMEAYSGLAILTTNMRAALDTAFLRRLRFVVNFPFPDAAHRARIWRRIFPPETPTEDLDFDKLAHLNVSGGSIRNIAMTAAFLAADAGEPVRMVHLRRSAESECQKLDKPVSSAEIGGWA